MNKYTAANTLIACIKQYLAYSIYLRVM